MTTTTANSTGRLTGRRALAVAFVALLLLTALLTALHLQRRAAVATDITNLARQSLSDSAARIDAAFATAQDLGDALAEDLASGILPFDQIPQRLPADLEGAPDVNGLAVTFAPFVYDPALRLFQVYVYRTPEGSIEALIGTTYDYTRPPSDDPNAPKTAWYYDTIRSGAKWSDPFLATGAGKVLIEYARPFAHPDGRNEPAGVVTSDLSLQEVRNLLARLDLGAQGYGFVIGRNGVFLDYSDRTRVARSNIFDAGAAHAPTGGESEALPTGRV
ncbi:MAG: cache domain-containing protein [Chloroflexaceae bacterium]|nr:cache domain-containing protein [Chloroflexaceae bacterium]